MSHLSLALPHPSLILPLLGPQAPEISWALEGVLIESYNTRVLTCWTLDLMQSKFIGNSWWILGVLELAVLKYRLRFGTS